MSISSSIITINDDNDSDTFAWLVPTASSSVAQRALHLAPNAPLVLRRGGGPSSSSSIPAQHYPSSPNPLPLDVDAVVRLSFSQTTKHPGCFTIGTDPSACDLVLLPTCPLSHQPSFPSSSSNSSFPSSSSSFPPTSNSSSSSSSVDTAPPPPPPPATSGSSSGPFISRQHCALTFDDAARLVLHDFSARGTAVWLGWESAGDLVDHTWVLSGPPPPPPPPPSVVAPDPVADPDAMITTTTPIVTATMAAATPRTVIDIQGAHFQLLLNTRLAAADPVAYRAKVAAFCAPQAPSSFSSTTITTTCRNPPAHEYYCSSSSSMSLASNNGGSTGIPPWLADDPVLAALISSSSSSSSSRWVRESLLAGSPPPRIFKHVVVKAAAAAHEPAASTQEVYLWNVARPWEPMVRASA
ncbi:hypothetical protein JDV02_007240 [Purpureocillium takamizusanense]|uniref:FHA domain-containing protein n=1 Tax=Purpureocillium takamizusanense TaxID=2060973 RepID=A0A9Q8VDJ4_9HYPO|nr:uncharacterized protein JDV02_007240 [Purpureocillium takamizusanense]UNI21231.1 hypothetical protein JDV02_007240 [Purpureocillium takamizusanense]